MRFMENAHRPGNERPRETLVRLVADEIKSLSDLKELLASDPWPPPSALAFQVATCNRHRLRTITEIEESTGCSLQHVTPPVLRSPDTEPPG